MVLNHKSQSKPPAQSISFEFPQKKLFRVLSYLRVKMYYSCVSWLAVLVCYERLTFARYFHKSQLASGVVAWLGCQSVEVTQRSVFVKCSYSFIPAGPCFDENKKQALKTQSNYIVTLFLFFLLRICTWCRCVFFSFLFLQFLPVFIANILTSSPVSNHIPESESKKCH